MIRIEVPRELTEVFRRVLEEMIEESKTRLILSLLEKTRLTEDETMRIGEEIKRGIAERHGV
ncbi:MAG: hypothetical protein ACUVQY_07325 [Thermoproteota archaeon]